MKINMGGVDRTIRALIGLVLIGLVLAGQIGMWGWIGAILLATSVFGICPLYSVLGVNSCSSSKKE